MFSRYVLEEFLDSLIDFINEFIRQQDENLLRLVTGLRDYILDINTKNISLRNLAALLTDKAIDDKTPQEIQAVFLYLCIVYASYKRSSNLGDLLDCLTVPTASENAAPFQISHLLYYSILAYDAQKKEFALTNLFNALHQRLIRSKIQSSEVLQILNFYRIARMPASTISALIRLYEQLLNSGVSPNNLPLCFINELILSFSNGARQLAQFAKCLLHSGLSPSVLLNSTSKILLEIQEQIPDIVFMDLYNTCFDRLPRNQDGRIANEDTMPKNLPAYLFYKGEIVKAAEGYTYIPALAHCIQHKKTHLIHNPPDSRQLSYSLGVLRAWEQYNLSPRLTLAALYNRRFVPSRIFRDYRLEENDIIKNPLQFKDSTGTYNDIMEAGFTAFTASEICLAEHLPFITEIFYYLIRNSYYYTDDQEQAYYQSVNSFFLFEETDLYNAFDYRAGSGNARTPYSRALKNLFFCRFKVDNSIKNMYLIYNIANTTFTSAHLNVLYQLTDWLLSPAFTNTSRINLKDWYQTSIGKLLLKNILQRLLFCQKAHTRRILGQMLLMLASLNPNQSFTIYRLQIIITLVKHHCPPTVHTNQLLSEFLNQHLEDKKPAALFTDDKSRRTISFRRYELECFSMPILIALRLGNFRTRQLVDEELLIRIQKKLLSEQQVMQIFGLACESGNVFLREACINYLNAVDSHGSPSWLVRAYLYDSFTGKMTEKLFTRWQSLFVYDESILHELFFAASLTWNASLIYRLYLNSRIPMVLASSFGDYVQYRRQLFHNLFSQEAQTGKSSVNSFSLSPCLETESNNIEFDKHLTQFRFFSAKRTLKDYVPGWHQDQYDGLFTALETIQKNLCSFIRQFFKIVALHNPININNNVNLSTFFQNSNRAKQLHDQLNKITKLLDDAHNTNIFHVQSQIERVATLIHNYIGELNNPAEAAQLKIFLNLKDNDSEFTFEHLRELIGAPPTLYTEHLKQNREADPQRSHMLARD